MSGVWYSRSGVQNNDDDAQEESQEEIFNYKTKYRNLKRKLKFLIYENQCFQESLRSAQHGLLKVNRDNSFLLDRLLQYEKVDITSSESEETESSDDGEQGRSEPAKRKIKTEPGLNSHNMNQSATTSGFNKSQSTAKKKRPSAKSPKQNIPPLQVLGSIPVSMLSDGHMTPEEVERHLESRQSYLELVPEKAPPTVPTEMFSNDPSLDSESNEICEFETSPSNLGDDCLSVDMLQDSAWSTRDLNP